MNEQQREALEALEILVPDGHPASGCYAEGQKARALVRTYILNSTPTREGWKLVPVEPTRGMMIASEGWREYDVPDHWVNCNEVRRVYGSYRAMLAAAPTPEEL